MFDNHDIAAYNRRRHQQLAAEIARKQVRKAAKAKTRKAGTS